MTAYVRDTETFLSGRPLTFLIIIGAHVAIIYAFANGMVHGVIKQITDRVVVVPVKDPPPRPVDPLPPPVIQQLTPSLKPDPLERLIPVVEDPVPVNVNPNLNLNAIIAEQGSPAPPVHVVKRVLGGLGKGFPNTDDFYPPQSIRLHQEGAPIVRTCVDEKGRLSAAPTLVQSSGTASLDEGALRLAKAGSGHYRPTTEDGQPVVSCYDFRVVFHIRN